MVRYEKRFQTLLLQFSSGFIETLWQNVLLTEEYWVLNFLGICQILNLYGTLNSLKNIWDWGFQNATPLKVVSHLHVGFSAKRHDKYHGNVETLTVTFLGDL